MSRDPAFLFYSSDFLIGTFGMSDAQVGQYIRLMCLQHQKGHLSEQLIKSITGGVLDSGVMAKFEQDEEGLYYNVRLEEESKKRAKYAESRRQNRRKHDTSSSYDNHMSNICASQDERMSPHMSPHMENENRNRNKDEIESEDEDVKDLNKTKKEPKHKYGEYKNVLLTDKELNTWKLERPRDWSERIEALSIYIASKGTAYKSHLATMRNWARKDDAKKSPEQNEYIPRGGMIIT